MSLADVLDSVRRVIHKWVNTLTPLTENVNVGSSTLKVKSSHRFKKGDQVMIKNKEVYETGLIIKDIIDDTTISLETSVSNTWGADGLNTVLIKTVNEQFVNNIYIGDPDVIARYPAITVNGTSSTSEWMTLESTKERYELEITVLVQDSTQEAGYRFLLNLVDVVQKGLKRNIVPLINDYDIISLLENVSEGDSIIKLNSLDLLDNYRRLIIEDQYNFEETAIDRIYEDGTSVHLVTPLSNSYSSSGENAASVVIPHRFIHNSWPSSIDYGKIHKGELLKAGVIKWFAEEEEIQFYRRNEHFLK